MSPSICAIRAKRNFKNVNLIIDVLFPEVHIVYVDVKINEKMVAAVSI